MPVFFLILECLKNAVFPLVIMEMGLPPVLKKKLWDWFSEQWWTINQHKAMMFLTCQAWWLLALSGQCNQQGVSCGGLMISIWSLWKPWHIKVDPMVWLLDIWSYLDLIFGVTGSLFRPFNLLLFYKADAVSCNLLQPVEAKPAALQKTMEAMGQQQHSLSVLSKLG